MKKLMKSVLIASFAIGLSACQVQTVSDHDSDEVVTCTVDEVLEQPSVYVGKSVLVTGVMPHSGIQDENGNMLYPLYGKDLQEYIVLSDASDPINVNGQEGSFQGIICMEDDIIRLKTE